MARNFKVSKRALRKATNEHTVAILLEILDLAVVFNNPALVTASSKAAARNAKTAIEAVVTARPEILVDAYMQEGYEEQ